MKFTKVKPSMCGSKTIRALCDDGTILGVVKRVTGKVDYFINSIPVKNTGKTNEVFSRNIDNFAAMIAHIKV